MGDMEHPTAGFRPAEASGYGAAGMGARMKAAKKRALGLTLEDALQALACILLPPIVFTVTTVLLCFRFRFKYPRGAWLVSGIVLAPAVLSGFLARRAEKKSADTRWLKLAVVLFTLAFVAAAVMGELNYWFFAQPYFLLDSLREYNDVDPVEVDGSRLMDAGTVHFAKGSRLALDMAMSYTSWDMYCVAPITNYMGLPSQGSQMEAYDLWAVGVNCCTSGQTNFRCGEYSKVEARGGLREVSAEARPYFRLAVQQAEAAYNIEARHPIFFYWVEDPVREKNLFFKAAFSNWVLANGMHSASNFFIVLAFVVMFNRKSKSADTHLQLALGS